MEVYNGLVCFDGSKDVRFGSLTRQDKEIEFKFRKAAWPKEKKYYTGYMNSATDRKPKNKASNFIDISNYNESRLTDRESKRKDYVKNKSEFESFGDLGTLPINDRLDNLYKLTAELRTKVDLNS